MEFLASPSAIQTYSLFLGDVKSMEGPFLRRCISGALLTATALSPPRTHCVGVVFKLGCFAHGIANTSWRKKWRKVAERATQPRGGGSESERDSERQRERGHRKRRDKPVWSWECKSPTKKI